MVARKLLPLIPASAVPTLVQFLGAVRVPTPALLEALLGEHRESLAQPVHRVDGARVVVDAGGLKMKGCTLNLI